MDKGKFGYRDDKWHPLWFTKDYLNWTETPEGKDYLERERQKTLELIEIRNKRIDYEKELKRSDLSPYQRQKYREILNKRKVK